MLRPLLSLLLSLSTSPAPPPPETVDPPRVEHQVEAVYPLDALASRREGVVTLLVTVDAKGAVEDASVAESAGEAFDHAALDAIRQWRFSPAKRNGTPIVSRVQVPFRFVFPDAPSPGAPHAHEVEPSPPPMQASPAGAATALTPTPSAAASTEASGTLETIVRGRKAAPPRSASDFVLEREVLAAAPHRTAGDLLGSAPGVYIA
ncbi:MAG: TonB family protein, partial [Myxococcaceae bacterium]